MTMCPIPYDNVSYTKYPQATPGGIYNTGYTNIIYILGDSFSNYTTFYQLPLSQLITGHTNQITLEVVIHIQIKRANTQMKSSSLQKINILIQNKAGNQRF